MTFPGQGQRQVCGARVCGVGSVPRVFTCREQRGFNAHELREVRDPGLALQGHTPSLTAELHRGAPTLTPGTADQLSAAGPPSHPEAGVTQMAERKNTEPRVPQDRIKVVTLSIIPPVTATPQGGYVTSIHTPSASGRSQDLIHPNCHPLMPTKSSRT